MKNIKSYEIGLPLRRKVKSALFLCLTAHIKFNSMF